MLSTDIQSIEVTLTAATIQRLYGLQTYVMVSLQSEVMLFTLNAIVRLANFDGTGRISGLPSENQTDWT
jgi:hypothetical protein